MKKILMLILFSVNASVLSAYDLTFKIPDEKISDYKTYFLRARPNTITVPDETWVDPGDGSERPRVKKYTDNEWFHLVIKNLIIRYINRGKYLMDQDQIDNTPIADDIE